MTNTAKKTTTHKQQQPIAPTKCLKQQHTSTTTTTTTTTTITTSSIAHWKARPIKIELPNLSKQPRATQDSRCHTSHQDDSCCSVVNPQQRTILY
ncbi:hypothetical protein DASC09_054180 [Saccharomycopsis crataegensis]|uniref:Uncharacterized protein n=1 Tax=Saccharomycopsis crataegensis TaxID=43959 RepID=A0AAV5QTC1_9ASCO|nr:hypothetical protein DASC09_054180 [Saccharomycopsis crataegensis]